MGFCLFEEASSGGMFFAVNSSQVEEIQPQRETASGYPSCLFKFPFTPKGFRPHALGSRVEISEILMKSARIGLQKVECQTFVGEKKLRHTPLLLNKTDRVVMVRELLPEEFVRSGISSPTASEVLMEDGTIKIIAERPGVFAARANADRKVPILNLKTRS